MGRDVGKTVVPDAACCALGYQSVGIGHEDDCEVRRTLTDPKLPESLRKSMFRCEVDGCPAHPMKGDLIIRVSAKGEPFRGRCERHYREAGNAALLHHSIVVWLHAGGFHDAATALAETDVDQLLSAAA